MRSERIGSAIGAVGGLAFVLANASALGSPLDVVARVLGGLLFLAVLALAVVGGRGDRAEAPPSRRQIRTYGFSVLGMVLAIAAGARLLTWTGYGDLVVLWVVLVVGLHFLPFARAFTQPLFTVLGWTLVALALVGAVLALALRDSDLAGVTAVVAGLVLLVTSLWPALTRGRGRARARG
ncbi:hypothetical protein [Auraticoccus monumenti]|uniref:Uncharacterized protein n=1 Tax=Auraticoccus monumenti TaxID=675864 RepID=A0A1G6VF80_9ACTN|nr:hypothetical protein [Auraticoccus monumenti]SDD52239.1 hypothetical protein SAMN04489747_1140 [Auraticoccus monumenti]